MAFAKIRPKGGTTNQWNTANTVLGERELGFEYNDQGLGKGPVNLKLGDGATAWNDLPYAINTVAILAELAAIKTDLANILSGQSNVMTNKDVDYTPAIGDVSNDEEDTV